MTQIRRRAIPVVIALLALVAGTATAQQQPAPAAASKHACTKPGEHPGRLASDTQQKTWTRNVNAYLECLKKFVAEEQAIAKPLIEQSKPHIDAANNAIDEYNKSAKEFREQLEKLDQ
ncbi:MAG: hypothetical protein ABI886_06485 [Betaproteobacteria bacterium]